MKKKRNLIIFGLVFLFCLSIVLADEIIYEEEEKCDEQGENCSQLIVSSFDSSSSTKKTVNWGNLATPEQQEPKEPPLEEQGEQEVINGDANNGVANKIEIEEDTKSEKINNEVSFEEKEEKSFFARIKIKIIGFLKSIKLFIFGGNS